MENINTRTARMASDADQQSCAKALIPFSGYYTLNANIGSFLMINTNMLCNIPPNPGTFFKATITISLDGQNSKTFLSEDNAFTFIGTNLVIPDFANLNFYNTSNDTSVTGTIKADEVSGTTPFGPVQPLLWSGTYYCQLPAVQINPPLYSYFPALQLNSDGTVLFGTQVTGLLPVSSYWYDYGMFVFGLLIDGDYHLFEMGTSTGWGRVAGNAHDGQMFVSIQLQEQAPIL